MTNQYKCQSYYDNDNVLQDCTCGKCGTDFREQVEAALILQHFGLTRLELEALEALPGKQPVVESVGLFLSARKTISLVDAIVKLHEAEVERIIGENIDLEQWAPNHISKPDTETAIQIEGKNRHNELLAEMRQRAAIEPKGGDKK